MPEVSATELAIHIWVEGRVQGVGFRAFVRGRAEELGLNGWVRNSRDGRVEAWASGESAALEAWVHAVQQGPRFAHVVSVDVQRDATHSVDAKEGFHVLH